ncbi:SURF4 family-domain-containing protein [Zychaea mexicana]|uniref:SURF4 family-domain-containing protein n=1 Tax=Zychaea mexicana TaxID=64656 RepID=UPI0022FE1BE2|nr:SURF4 family-domain-containing protein [Zychaea mexicana]KAI9495755.1 SURF4 family-domain-containing protein [Zychaea mexicana]
MSFDSTLKTAGDQIELVIDTWTRPIKPHLQSISRFLIVATFYEDALRIVAQWGIQLAYLSERCHLPRVLTGMYLVLNVASMLVFSSFIITKRHVTISVVALLAVVGTQALMYGLVFDMLFFLRNLSIMGGLLLCLSESLLRRHSSQKSSTMFALPQMSESERHKYFQLAGRVLLVLLFVGFIFNGEWGFLRVTFSLIGFAACVMVAVGFRARWSATFLVSLLCVMNMLLNNWTGLSGSQRDFVKYDFFQTLSIVGGLLLLISIGPGGLSYDEKKKEF